jgi:hypothetical protein
VSATRWQEPNLARAPFVNERPVRRLGVALWVLFAIVGGAGLWMSQTIRRETGTRVAELARLNAETVGGRERAVALEAELRRANLPAQNERAEFLNRRLAERTFSWNNLLETLAGVMPRGVRLIGLSPQGFARQRGRTVGSVEAPATTQVAMRITGEAEETEALLEFVDRLFAHPAFDRPNLSRESAKKDDKIQFDLTVDYLPQVAAQPGLLAAADESGEGHSDAPAAGQASAASRAATAAITAGTAGSESGVQPVDGGRIQSGEAAPGSLPSSASQPEAVGAKPLSRSARQPADRVGRAAPGAAPTPEFGGSSDDPAAADSAPGGRVRPDSPTPGGTRFPVSVMPTPLRPYASGVGGGR